MPVYVTAYNSRIENVVFQKLEGKDAITYATTMAQTAQATRQWNPLTLLGAGMFHLAFGALLTGGAVTRGMAKRSEVEGYYKYGNINYDSYDSRENTPNKPISRVRPTDSDGPMPKTNE